MSKPKWHSTVIHSVVALLVVTLALALSSSLVPVLAEPIVNSVTETAFGTDTRDHNANMPATVNAGDLLIVLFTNDGNAAVTTPAGWNLLASDANGNSVRASVYYKIAAGTEGGTSVNFITSRGEQAAAQVYRITDWHGTTPPEISTATTDSDEAPDPASLNPVGWDVANTLWLAVAGQDRGDQGAPTAYPASYTDGVSTVSSNGNKSCRVHSARRVLASASEDPGAFTIPVAQNWVAFTIAVRPIRYDLTTSSTGGGSVNTPGEGTFSYDCDTVVDLIAQADACYEFVNWSGDVSTIPDVNAASTNITMNGDYSITANFALLSYNLTAGSTTGGSVTDPGEGTFTYDCGSVVDLIAQADDCYEFVNWSGDVSTISDVNAASTNITMSGDYSITANFALLSYNITADSTTGGSVTDPGEGTFTYDCGSVVDLVAEAEKGYRFVEWTGDVSTISDIYAASTNITVNGDYSFTAEFVAIYNLTMAADPGVGGAAIDLTNESPYAAGTGVSIKAEANLGYEFVNWTAPAGGFNNASAAETIFTMPAQNVTVTANFEEITPPPEYPTVTTQAATDITTNSATPNMSYTVGNCSLVEVCFAYKKSTDSAWSSTDWVSKNKDGTYAEPLTGLYSSTTYDFKAQLRYNATVIESTTLQFTTATSSTPRLPEGCFIATAAYGTPTAEQIDILREFRDVVLLESTAGSQFVTLYYQLSPPVADFIAGNSFLRILVRELLVDPIVWVVEATGEMWRN